MLIRSKAELIPLRDCCVDSVVTDPPAGIFFMGSWWDHDRGGRGDWVYWMTQVSREMLRCLKPGGHALVWALPRTSHWTATALEDAGFEIRDVVTHHFGSGFPKNHNVSKSIDKRGGSPHLDREIGEAIKEARTRRGLSISECDRIFCGGTTNWTWFEGRPVGQRAPAPETFEKIVAAWPELAILSEKVDEAEREKTGQHVGHMGGLGGERIGKADGDITVSATEAAKQWEGFGTALKPASEHWILCRKPLIGTVAANVLEHGTGALNIDASRIGTDDDLSGRTYGGTFSSGRDSEGNLQKAIGSGDKGRWPANLVLTHSEGCGSLCVEGCPVAKFDRQSDGGSEFFYTAKPSTGERNSGGQNTHPTVKPTSLMAYLIRLITPPGGLVLDPFFGSGTTGKAATEAGFRFVGCELEREYLEIASGRVKTQMGFPF